MAWIFLNCANWASAYANLGMYKQTGRQSYWFLVIHRSGGSIVDNTLDYLSRAHRIVPQRLRSFG